MPHLRNDNRSQGLHHHKCVLGGAHNITIYEVSCSCIVFFLLGVMAPFSYNLGYLSSPTSGHRAASVPLTLLPYRAFVLRLRPVSVAKERAERPRPTRTADNNLPDTDRTSLAAFLLSRTIAHKKVNR